MRHERARRLPGLALGRGAADRAARRRPGAVRRLPEPARHLLAAAGPARARHRGHARRRDRRRARRRSASRSRAGGSTCSSAAGSRTAAASTLAFSIAPRRSAAQLRTAPRSGPGSAARLFAAALIAAAPFSRGRVNARGRARSARCSSRSAIVLALCLGRRARRPAARCRRSRPRHGDQQPFAADGRARARRRCCPARVVGFGLRFRARRQRPRPLARLAATLALFAELHYVFTPLLSQPLRLAGRLPAPRSRTACCSSACGGRSASPSSGARSPRSAPASRARSTTGSRSTCSPSRPTRACSRAAAPLETDAAAAQGGGRGRAAGGAVRRARALVGRRHGAVRRRAAPLRRLPHRRRRSSRSSSRSTTAIRLAPDEQIEVFRIVQEGLANARKHAGARRAEVHDRRARGRALRRSSSTTARASTRPRRRPARA